MDLNLLAERNVTLVATRDRVTGQWRKVSAEEADDEKHIALEWLYTTTFD